jgi:pilus assembly protein Flp/PilA
LLLDTTLLGGMSQTQSHQEWNMRRVIAQVQRFLVNEDGPTAVEYAVLVGLIILALVTVISNMASSVSGSYSAATSVLNGAS